MALLLLCTIQISYLDLYSSIQYPPLYGHIMDCNMVLCLIILSKDGRSFNPHTIRRAILDNIRHNMNQSLLNHTEPAGLRHTELDLSVTSVV